MLAFSLKGKLLRQKPNYQREYRQDVKCQAISLVFLRQWLQAVVDMGMKNNSDLGEFLLFFQPYILTPTHQVWKPIKTTRDF